MSKDDEQDFFTQFVLRWMKANPPDHQEGLRSFLEQNHRQVRAKLTPFVDVICAADIAILIALKEEWDVFWPIAGQPTGLKDELTGRYYFSFEVPSVTDRPYRCVAICMDATGPAQAVDASHALLVEKPKTLVNLGIAAAIHDDLRLGDVVVAEQVDSYLETTKAVPRGRDKFSFEFRGSVYKTTFSLVEDVKNIEFAHPEAFERWRCACHSAAEHELSAVHDARRKRLIREVPQVCGVHLASGPAVAASESFARWIRSRDSLLKSLEMEAAGMMLAAHQRRDPASTLVLRGISDFGDRRKSRLDSSSGGAFRRLAMRNATHLLWAMMGCGLLPRHVLA